MRYNFYIQHTHMERDRVFRGREEEKQQNVIFSVAGANLHIIYGLHPFVTINFWQYS